MVEGGTNNSISDKPNGFSQRNNDDSCNLPGCAQSEFNLLYQYKKPKKPGARQQMVKCLKCHPKDTIHHLFPITEWLPKYQWRSDIAGDLISGVTVAIMHIPQGMAYALLGGVAPVVGIYMAFFPVLLYILMGTSRHISMGTFAVACMMVSKSVILYSDPIYSMSSVGNSSTSESGGNVTNATHGYTPLEVATAVCFAVGIWQVLLGICRLGILSVLLSETLVSGFTTGAAIHVAASQVKNLLGVNIGRHNGPLKIIYMLIDIIENINKSNPVAVGISVGTILLLSLYNELIKPRVDKKLPIPIPVELLAVISGALLSMLTHLEANYGIAVVGDIPTGLPNPIAPPFALVPLVLVDGLVIAIVAFSVNMSMASIFSRKLNYNIDANQELIASGCSNVFGSFFSCMPFAASLSRSMIQQTVGGKTQLASVVSCLLLLLILLVIGPFFEPLPNCVLASIVVVALKSMFLQIGQLPGLWRHSRLDGMVWLGTFVSAVLLDIDYGLGIGIMLSLLSLVAMGQWPTLGRLGHVPNTSLYLDMEKYQAAVETSGVCIVRISGGLHFANCEGTQQRLYRLLSKVNTNTNHHEHLEMETNNDDLSSKSVPKNNSVPEETSSLVLNGVVKPVPLSCVILDMTAVNFVDPSAMKTLLYIYNDMTAKGILFYMAACSVSVYESFEYCQFFCDFPTYNIFSSLHNAVTFAQQELRDSCLLRM